MREYKHEAFEVTSQDVGYAWLIVGVILSAMLLLSVVLEASGTLALLTRHLLDAIYQVRGDRRETPRGSRRR